MEKSLYADHVAVLRPNIPEEEIAGALAEAFGHLGKLYDYEFDFSVSSRIVCTELIYRCYHHRGTLEFPLIKRLGRYTLSGDDIALLAAHSVSSGDDPPLAPFRLVRLVLKGPTGEACFIPETDALETLRQIHAGWRPTKVKVA